MLTGVVEVGLFCGMAKAAYFGNEVRSHISHLSFHSLFLFQDGSVTVRYKDGKEATIDSSAIDN